MTPDDLLETLTASSSRAGFAEMNSTVVASSSERLWLSAERSAPTIVTRAPGPSRRWAIIVPMPSAPSEMMATRPACSPEDPTTWLRVTSAARNQPGVSSTRWTVVRSSTIAIACCHSLIGKVMLLGAVITPS